MEEKALTIIVSCGVRLREERSVSSSMALSTVEEEDFGEERRLLLLRDDETVVGAGDHAETLLLPL